MRGSPDARVCWGSWPRGLTYQGGDATANHSEPFAVAKEVKLIEAGQLDCRMWALSAERLNLAGIEGQADRVLWSVAMAAGQPCPPSRAGLFLP